MTGPDPRRPDTAGPDATDPDAAGPDADPPATLIPAITAVTLVQAVVTMGAVVPATVAPELARSLDVPTALIGVQVSLAYSGAVAVSFVTGRLVRRWGAVRTSQAACALTAAGAVLIAASTLVTLAIGSLVIGIAYGLTNPAASHLLTRLRSGATGLWCSRSSRRASPWAASPPA